MHVVLSSAQVHTNLDSGKSLWMPSRAHGSSSSALCYYSPRSDRLHLQIWIMLLQWLVWLPSLAWGGGGLVQGSKSISSSWESEHADYFPEHIEDQGRKIFWFRSLPKKAVLMTVLKKIRLRGCEYFIKCLCSLSSVLILFHLDFAQRRNYHIRYLQYLQPTFLISELFLSGQFSTR